MSACVWCGAAEGSPFERVHWEGCRMVDACAPEFLTVLHRSQPPRIDFDLGGRPILPPRTSPACYACWEREAHVAWPVSYSWCAGSGNWHRGAGWVPLCLECGRRPKETLEEIVNHGAREETAATTLTAEEVALYQPIADAVRHWDQALADQGRVAWAATPITELLPMAYRLGTWDGPWNRT